MESEHITPDGRLKITCNELEFSLVDLSTGEISCMGYDPLGIVCHFGNPMDDECKEMLAQKIDDNIEEAIAFYFRGNENEF